MILIDQIFISNDIITEQFICDLDKCKGACCIEGDGGAPLLDGEAELLSAIYEKVKPYLVQSGIEAIEQQGFYTQSDNKKVTPLVNGGACAYLTWDGLVSKCGIEKAWEEGKIEFQKPISCHLYPIRIDAIGETEALNYYFWDICSAACKLGKKHKTPVYQFLKEPLIRKYGEAFYEKLDATAKHLAEQADAESLD